MPEKPKFKETPGAPSVALDSRLIDKAVVDLHIARRIVLIYPATHDQVKQSLTRAYKSLCAVLARQPSLTLTVQKDGLAAGGQSVASTPTVLADLAAVLKQYQIGALTLSQGLQPQELVGLLKLITTDREKILAQGGIAGVAAKMALPHIRLQTVDYSKLRLTEESEIQRSSRRDMDGSIWQDFVAHLLTGSDRVNPGVSNSAGLNLNPSELAGMLNRKILDPGTAVDQFASAVSVVAGSGPERASLSEGWLFFQEMIKELNPELQKQFLGAAFDRCARTDSIADTARLIDGLGGELIIDMLRQASSQGKQISPSLIAFITKMGHLNLPGSQPAQVPSMPANQGLSQKKLESLLAVEQYDTYVDSGYGELLNALSRKPQENAGDPETRTLIQEIASDLDDARLHAHVGRAMTRLMTASPDLAGYRDWARQLAYLLNELLEARAFEYLAELMQFIRSEHETAKPQRAQIAGLLLNRFSDPQFVAKAIDILQKPASETPPEALAFFLELGEPVLLEIFDGLEPSQTFHDEEVVTQILCQLSAQTAKEALARVKDPRPAYVRRMLRIIRKMGDSETAQKVRSLMNHPNLDVRLEALATLLHFNNKWGLIHLRELLDNPAEAEFMPALRLAGDYRVRDVVPKLLAIVRQRRDFEQREAALRALGRIGDARAIPTLVKLAYRRWGIPKKQIQHLKQVLYETLGGYPMEQIKDLLHYGLKQKDQAIQETCRSLLREGVRADERGAGR
jgi:HEAT repeats